MCGEKLGSAALSAAEGGSPPHVRGKVALGLYAKLGLRITPACAGKSWVNRQFLRGSWDHPRMCGEKTKKIP